jgi:hypothetical protein
MSVIARTRNEDEAISSNEAITKTKSLHLAPKREIASSHISYPIPAGTLYLTPLLAMTVLRKSFSSNDNPSPGGAKYW